jgi:hypothetical protein
MISRLSELLRLSLEESHAQRVPLSRELQFLECYLAIQQIRFQDRLTVTLDIAFAPLSVPEYGQSRGGGLTGEARAVAMNGGSARGVSEGGAAVDADRSRGSGQGA